MKTDANNPSESVVAEFASDLPPPAPQGRVFCGDLDIRIDCDGNWHYQGSPINRKELVCLFASVLTRDKDGTHWLVTPAEIGRVEVEDAPFLAVELFRSGNGRDQVLSFRTNVDQIVAVDEGHPIRIETDPETGEPAPYVAIHRRMEARLSRSVYYELVDLGAEETHDHERVFGVWSNGHFFALGRLEA